MRELRARRLASQANKDLTHKMQTVLSGLESPYRKIEWKIDATQAIQSQTLPKAVAEIVQTFLNDAGLKCSTVTGDNPDQVVLAIEGSPDEIDPQKIISEHRKKVLKAMQVPEDALPMKELVESINTAWDELSKSSEDAFNLLRDAPPIIIDLAEKLDELFVGMKKSTMQRSNSEVAVLSSVYYSNLFLSLFAKASPDIFRLAFKKTPLGPIFIAGYQIVSDAFFAKKWREGRKKHMNAQFTMGSRALFFSEWYNVAHNTMMGIVKTKTEELKSVTGFSDTEVDELIKKGNTESLMALSDNKRAEATTLIREVNELNENIAEAAKSIKGLTSELRKKASRVNTEQQVLMATKHIDRIFNLTFIGLGIASFFFPPLAIPATILAVGKGAARKKIEDRMRTGTQIVQGIYELDNDIVVSKGNNKGAITKSKGVKKMNLQYAPVAVVGIKLGLTQKGSFARTQKLIRDNPEYTLYIPQTFSYQSLGVNATRRAIRGQIDNFSLTCRQLIFHLGVIQGRDLNGELPKDAVQFLHPPHIHNINELNDLLDTWYKDVTQQIRDQKLNQKSGKNSYFTDKHIETIESLYTNAKNYIEAYQNRVAALDRKDNDEVRVSRFDMEFADKMHASIVDEIVALNSVLNNKTGEQSVINAVAIKERLDHRLKSLLNYCDKCPDESQRSKFNNWKEDLEVEINRLDRKMQTIQLPKPSVAPNTSAKSPSVRNLGIEVKPSLHDQIFVTVQHPRYFESRNAIVNRLMEHVAQRNALTNNDKRTELVLLPVAKVSNTALFNYRGSYWKMIWLVRGIERALESIELTVKNKEKIGVEINPENLKSLLEFYQQQLKKINDASKTFTFLKAGQDIVKSRVQQAIIRTEALLEPKPAESRTKTSSKK